VKELLESEIVDRLSTAMDNIGMVFPVVMRKIMFSTMMKAKIGSSDMHTLVLSGLETGSLTPSEISRIFSISKPNVTTLVGKLIDKGYVERSHDEVDRRVVRISLTRKGRNLIMKRRKIVKEHVLNAFAKLSPDEIMEISKTMENSYDVLIKMDKIL